MIWGTIVLIANVLCVLIALMCLCLCLMASIRNWEFGEEQEQMLTKRGLRLAIFWFGVGFVVTTSAAFKLYMYLSLEMPHMLELFALWYAMGFVLRFFTLILRGSVLSRVYATEQEEILFALGWALLGPFVLFSLVHEIERVMRRPR
jgi:hypothetical protein